MPRGLSRNRRNTQGCDRHRALYAIEGFDVNPTYPELVRLLNELGQ